MNLQLEYAPRYSLISERLNKLLRVVSPRIREVEYNKDYL
eukprot:UN17422